MLGCCCCVGAYEGTNEGTNEGSHQGPYQGTNKEADTKGALVQSVHSANATS